MKALPWVLAGMGVGAAIAYVMLNGPQPQAATGPNAFERAAGRAWFWGSKTRAGAAGRDAVGRLKEGLGRVTGDRKLAEEGIADQAIGGVQDAVGAVAQATGETIHNLNRA
jgi:uncharacterized protein YjbJ (UPF0337 family)